jgi:hypothetical protein
LMMITGVCLRRSCLPLSPTTERRFQTNTPQEGGEQKERHIHPPRAEERTKTGANRCVRWKKREQRESSSGANGASMRQAGLTRGGLGWRCARDGDGGGASNRTEPPLLVLLLATATKPLAAPPAPHRRVFWGWGGYGEGRGAVGRWVGALAACRRLSVEGRVRGRLGVVLLAALLLCCCKERGLISKPSQNVFTITTPAP